MLGQRKKRGLSKSIKKPKKREPKLIYLLQDILRRRKKGKQCQKSLKAEQVS